MALESPFGGGKARPGPQSPDISNAPEKGKTKGIAKKATNVAISSAAGAAGGPGAAKAAETALGSTGDIARKIPGADSPFGASRGREATAKEVADSMKDIKGGKSITDGKKKSFQNEDSTLGSDSAVNDIAASPFSKNTPSKSLKDVASEVGGKKFNADSSKESGSEETETEDSTEEQPSKTEKLQKMLAAKKGKNKKSKGKFIAIAVLLLVVTPLLFMSGCMVMVASIGGTGGGIVNFSSQEDDKCETGDYEKPSKPDLQGSNKASANLRQDVESVGEGMEVKKNDVFLDSPEVKAPIAGKIEEASGDSVTIKSTRPGQDVTVKMSGFSANAKKGKTVNAGDVIGTATQKKKPKIDSKEEKLFIVLEATQDGESMSAERFFNLAAGNDTEDSDDVNTESPNKSKTSKTTTSSGKTTPTDTSTSEQPELGLNAEQVHNAKMVIAIGEQMGLGENAIVGGLDVAQQESTLLNYGNNGNGAKSPMGGSNGSPVDGKYLAKSMDDSRVSPTAPPGQDNNSTGIFQQQTVLESDGKEAPKDKQVWGTWEQSMDPAYAAWKFFSVYQEKYPDQAKNKNAPSSSVYGVQGSVDDSRPAAHHQKSQSFYDKWKGEGKKQSGLVDKVSNGITSSSTTSSSNGDDDDCSTSGSGNESSSNGGKGGGQLEANEGSLAANILKLAEGEDGKPYSQAAGQRSLLPQKNPSHHDCSSFVAWLYWNGAGVWASDDASGWGWYTGAWERFNNKSGIHILSGDSPYSNINPEKDLKPGDAINVGAVGSTHHFYMYAGNGEEWAAHSDGIPLSKSKPWTADAGGDHIMVYRLLNANSPEEIAGAKPADQQIPENITKLWKEGKKW